MLAGKKTFIFCGLAAVFALACGMGLIDGETPESKAILTCLFSAAGISLRLGVKNGG